MAVADFNRTMIDAMEGLAGRHAGCRRAHARGVILEGAFVPSGAAIPFTTAPHLRHDRVPAVVRFSHTSADPGAADGTPTLRLAVQSGSHCLGVCHRAPGVHAAFKFGGETAVPVSYGTTRCWATHSFVWIDEAGRRRFVRYTWEPVEGEQAVSTSQGRGFSPTHHTEELLARLKGGTVSFTLRVQFALPGDPITDSTQLWPDDREQINVGTLEITGLAADEQRRDATTFDPTRTGDGSEPSGDPVLLARGAPYHESLSRRTQETGGNR
jgi:catalase